MIGEVVELKEGLTWLRKMEVDDNCDDCGDKTSCNVSVIDFENFMFPFSIR